MSFLCFTAVQTSVPSHAWVQASVSTVYGFEFRQVFLCGREWDRQIFLESQQVGGYIRTRSYLCSIDKPVHTFTHQRGRDWRQQVWTWEDRGTMAVGCLLKPKRHDKRPGKQQEYIDCLHTEATEHKWLQLKTWSRSSTDWNVDSFPWKYPLSKILNPELLWMHSSECECLLERVQEQ